MVWASFWAGFFGGGLCLTLLASLVDVWGLGRCSHNFIYTVREGRIVDGVCCRSGCGARWRDHVSASLPEER